MMTEKKKSGSTPKNVFAKKSAEDRFLDELRKGKKWRERIDAVAARAKINKTIPELRDMCVKLQAKGKIHYERDHVSGLARLL